MWRGNVSTHLFRKLVSERLKAGGGGLLEKKNRSTEGLISFCSYLFKVNLILKYNMHTERAHSVVQLDTFSQGNTTT